MSESGLSSAAAATLHELAPRVLGAVVRRCGDFAAAEDAVQEALLAAIAEWPTRGLPRNPGGWLYHAACRNFVDHRRSEHARQEREAKVAASTPELMQPKADDDDALDVTLEDETLILLFTCCHPALTTPSAIALTLRAVGGLTTAEIASAFLVPETTMAQRISRAKRTIQTSGVPFALPPPAERTERLTAVLHVLYLIFNEGYTTSSGPHLIRVELATEAIRLARALHRAQPDHPEAAGLLALMLLTDARRRARTGPAGELIPLDEQDRTLWDRSVIAEGQALIAATFAKGSVGSYQIQAAIAALHDEAPSVTDTDWPQILALYEMMRTMSDNPMVAINHAVAAAMVHGPAFGLKLVAALATDARIAGHFRLDAVRAHLHERAGDRAAAIRCYLAAAGGTTSLPERHYLVAKAARLRES